MSHLETNEGQGNGESFIRQWTSQNKLSKFTDVFIEMELSIDELLFLAVRPKEIEEFCAEHGIKSIHKKRFEDALIKLVSKHSKTDDKNEPRQQIIVATLSVEEEQIINKINEEQKKNKEKKDKIDNLMKTVENKHKLCANNINLTFTELHKTLDERKNKLLQDLETISAEKKNTLLATKKTIEEINKKIKSFQTSCNELLLNWKMDKIERKQKIIHNGGNIMNDKSLSLQINPDINIEFKYDKNKTNEFVSTFGFVDGIGVPNPPAIIISEIYYDKVKITGTFAGKNKEIQSLQVEIAEFKGDYENDMKLEWNNNEFKVKEENELYDIKQLKSKSNYAVKGRCKNQKGWSTYGAAKTFKTKNILKTKASKFVLYNTSHFVVSNNGKTLKGKSHCYSSTAYIGNGYNSGIHTCSIKWLSINGCYRQIGITSGERKTDSTKGTSYHFTQNGGYSYCWKGDCEQPQWKRNAVITLTLDCEDWKVTFATNNTQFKQENIEKNQTYHFALDSCGTARYSHFEIV